MPDFMKQMKYENVVMAGEVKDGAEFVSDKAITVVPLLSGSGIRLKILEAMAASKLVISTTIGAQGIDYENGKKYLDSR
jgi:glycosyltransferase involved in cell wall biosynthesis